MIRLATPTDYDAALKIIGDAFGLVVVAPTVHTIVADAPTGSSWWPSDDGADRRHRRVRRLRADRLDRRHRGLRPRRAGEGSGAR